MILLFCLNAISVTIQSPIRKTAAVQLLFAHAVTSPHKLCQMFLRMQAFDVHIAIICTALNSCKFFRYALYYRIYFENSRGICDVLRQAGKIRNIDRFLLQVRT